MMKLVKGNKLGANQPLRKSGYGPNPIKTGHFPLCRLLLGEEVKGLPVGGSLARKLVSI